MRKHMNPKTGMAYLEGHLDAAQYAKLERHLADCAECRAMLNEHQAIHQALQAAGQDFTPQPGLIPTWANTRQRRQRHITTKGMIQAGWRLAVVGTAVIAVFVALLPFLPQINEFEPAAQPGTTPAAGPSSTATVLPVTSTPTALPTTTLPVQIVSPTLSIAYLPSATPTPTGSPMTGANVSAPILNGRGGVAFVQEGVLFVDTAAGANPFTAIAGQVVWPDAAYPITWSPDGRTLLFFQVVENGTNQVVLWHAGTQQLQPLSDVVRRRLPALPLDHARWSPDGRRLLLTTNGALDPSGEWTHGIWVADLETGGLTLVVEAIALADALWLSDNTFLLQLDCGLDCAFLMAYDLQRNLLWKAYANREEMEVASNLFALTADRQRLVHLNTTGRIQTVDVLETASGQVTTIWELPTDLHFARELPYLSPDGRALIFTAVDAEGKTWLYLVDIEGKFYGRREDSRFLAWRPDDGGAVVADNRGPSQNQLVYWSLDGSIPRIFVRPRAFVFSYGAWRPDAQYFVYNAQDPGVGAAYLYLWQPEDGIPALVHAAASDEPFQNLTWAPDGQRIYFTLRDQELWQYDLEMGVLTLITTSG